MCVYQIHIQSHFIIQNFEGTFLPSSPKAQFYDILLNNLDLNSCPFIFPVWMTTLTWVYGLNFGKQRKSVLLTSTQPSQFACHRCVDGTMKDSKNDAVYHTPGLCCPSVHSFSVLKIHCYLLATCFLFVLILSFDPDIILSL